MPTPEDQPLTDPLVDQSRSVGALFAAFDRYRRVRGDDSLGTADLRLLWLLSDGRARTLRQISDELGLEQSTVNRQVNGAIRTGLLVRQRQEGTYTFTSSDTGDAKFESYLSTMLSAYRDALETLGDRREEFLELLRVFIEAYGSSAGTRP